MERNAFMADADATTAARAADVTVRQREQAAGASVVTRRPRKSVKVLKKEKAVDVENPASLLPETKRVAAYCRVSTDKEEQESSLQTQMESFRTLIAEHPGWELADVYADEGISGTQVRHRDSFMRMIADCKAGKVDYILTKSISRFARNTVECLTYVRELRAMGVYVYFEKERLDTINDASEMVLSILASIAQEESRSISENIKWNQRKRYQDGIAKWAATFGFKKEGDEEYLIDEETAPTVRRIFDEYIHGKKAKEIAAELEAEGVPAPKGGHWQYSTVDFLLTNEKYCGDAQCQKSYVENHLTHKRRRNDQTLIPGYYIHRHHEGIVSREDFELAQTVRNLRSRKGKRIQYPYGDKITCPVCGRKMERIVLERTTSPAVWRCPPERGIVACAGHYVDEKYFDESLRTAYRELPMDELEKQTRRRDEKVALAAQEAMRMKREMPELGGIEYFFLHSMVREISFKKWDTMVISWKCGLKSTVHVDYTKVCDFPDSEAQRNTNISKRWVAEAARAAERMEAEATESSEARDETESEIGTEDSVVNAD
ncbi:MAG: recombinase family protein [Lachnospiraceae bacterium]|nr:recombinase family protein [Lachnospiraceae bacterium]